MYATPQHVSIGDDPEPPRPSNLNLLGAVPDVDAKIVPRNASFMGYSQIPRGEIVRSQGSVSSRETYGLSGDDSVSLIGVVGIGILGLVGYWIYTEAKDRLSRRRSA